jgi:hypothetical protein
MQLLFSAEEYEVGSVCAFTVDDLPAKLKNPTWTLSALLSDSETGTTLAETPDVACLANSSPPILTEGVWNASVVPGGVGSLTITVVLNAPTATTASATVRVVAAPTPQERLEVGFKAGDLESVRLMLGGAPASDDVSAGTPAEADAVSAEAAEATAEEALAEPAAVSEEPEGGWVWVTPDGEALIDLLASLEAAEEAKLEVLTLMLSHGATIAAKPVARADPPSALHWAITRGETRLAEAILAHCPPEAIAAQCASPLSNRVGFTPLHVACEVGDAAMVRTLVSSGAALDGPLGTPTATALCTRRGDLAMVKALVDAGGAGLLRLGTQDARSSALALANAAADEKPPSIEPDALVVYLLEQPVILQSRDPTVT